MKKRATVKSEREACAKIARRIEKAYRKCAREAPNAYWKERYDCYANVAQTIAENIEERGK